MKINLPVTTNELMVDPVNPIVTKTDVKGSITYANDNSSHCTDANSIQSCKQGVWGSASKCGNTAPMCVDGACVVVDILRV